ncbi:MAG: hypothetical protein Q4G68_04835 [Planctomycetia bacterium]|nr:hypothetical protein [Planctomycetia bacterium]
MKHFYLLTMLVTLTLAGGCSGNRFVSTSLVEGTVTFKGKPVGPGATVTFIPASSENPEFAVGTTDESGKYTLTSHHGKVMRGAVEGDYHVTILWAKIDEQQTDQSEAEKSTLGSSPPIAISGGPKKNKIKNLIPEKYRDESTSDLKATVVKGTNVINFEL